MNRKNQTKRQTKEKWSKCKPHKSQNFSSRTEDEDVLGAHLLSHLDVGPIQGSDGEGAVQHELHVASAGGLSARGGDLLTEVRSWDDPLR